ncbi:metalloregulator ArsR/SmtB family transcription factor [Nocardia sp. NPDC050710]|uniref:ArsR/SmtB family transcription factor n=1 Tax=Nocardia sp. NPDC050710 TaxID=3157220 RepID=UPI0033C3A2C9
MAVSAARIFEALGDPVRRGILELMSTGEQSAGAIVDVVQRHTPISQPAVSQHLKVLRDAGLVSVRAEGTRRVYALDPEALEAAISWLAHLSDPLARFAQPLDALATEIARGKRAHRQRTTGSDIDAQGTPGGDVRPA